MVRRRCGPFMVEVYEKNWHLTVWWLDEEQAVATLRGTWLGPIRAFEEPSAQ